MGTLECAVWSRQRPALTSFDAELQQQPSELFERRTLLRASAADQRQHAVLQQQPRQFPAALIQSAAFTVVFGAANLFSAQPQLSSSVTLLLCT